MLGVLFLMAGVAAWKSGWREDTVVFLLAGGTLSLLHSGIRLAILAWRKISGQT